jgi:hypothetical protein
LLLCIRPRRIGEFADGWHAVDRHGTSARIGKALREVGNVMIGMALAAISEGPRSAFVNKGLEGAAPRHVAAQAKARCAAPAQPEARTSRRSRRRCIRGRCQEILLI